MLISTRSEGDLVVCNYQERDRHASHNSQTEGLRHTCVRLVLCHQMRNFRAMSHFYNINCWIELIYYIADYTSDLYSDICRHEARQIYTYIGDVCVSVNPYTNLDIYNMDFVNQYKGRDSFNN